MFQFHYNDETYDIKVLEIKPDTEQHAIVTMETDLEVDFATPVGYKPPERTSGASTPGSVMRGKGGTLSGQGSMAQSINYKAIAPEGTAAADGAKVVSSHFLGLGNKLKPGKSSKAPTPLKASTPIQGASTNEPGTAPTRRKNGPQPLRLPPGKLFFGYEVKPLRKKNSKGELIADDEEKPKFQGQGQSLRQGKKKVAGGGTDSGVQSGVDSDAEVSGIQDKKPGFKGTGAGGRTLR